MKYKQITDNERYIIEFYLKEGWSLRKIADKLKKHVSSISRELKRNTGLRGYRHKQAQNFSEIRKINKSKPYKMTPEIRIELSSQLKEYWSPDQISSRLMNIGVSMVSPITIYRYISQDKNNGGSLWKFLRHSNRKRRKKYGSLNSRGYIPNRTSIDERPKIVDLKTRIGDWEIDTMVGANHKGILVTIVERATKFTLIGKCVSKKVKDINKTILKLLLPYKKWIYTITSDNGKEFAGHEYLALLLDAEFYFAHPYCSWERGLNENTNGLIRQFFPKGMSFKEITIRAITKVINLLNNRPRKDLNYLTPNEVFFN